MARVEIYRLRRGGLQDTIATCRLRDDGVVVCEGDPRIVRRLTESGILDRTVKPPERVFPQGGRRFLKALNSHFKSGYLTASEILNSDPNHVE